MVVTVVLRLLAEPLETGELVGRAELVSSGVTESVRNADELVAFVRRGSAGPTGAALPSGMNVSASGAGPSGDLDR